MKIKVNFSINIEKKYAFIIIGLFAAILVAVLGYAYNLEGVGGNPAVAGHSVDEIDWSKPLSVFNVKTGPNANLQISRNVSLNGAVSISTFNDAGDANTPLEIRASKTSFPVGDVCTNAGGTEKCLSSAGSSYRAYNSGWIVANRSCNDQCGGAEMVLFSYARNPDGSQMEIYSSWTNPGLYGRCVCIIRV